MSESEKLLAIFVDIDPATEAIAKLHELGIGEQQVSVISGIPLKSQILGRPGVRTNVPRFALAGAVVGAGLAVFLLWGIPLLEPLYVGGQPLFPVPPLFIVTFELAMLGMMCATFLGVFIENRFPSYEPKEYVPEVSDGKIAVLFDCPSWARKRIENAMKVLGAELVRPVEVQQP